MNNVCADLQVCAGGHAHQLAEVHVQPQLDLLLVFTLVSVLNGLCIACVCSMTCMLLNPLHAINYTTHHVCSVSAVGWILNVYGHSFTRECMLRPLLFLFLLQLIRMFVQLHVLPELLLQQM